MVISLGLVISLSFLCATLLLGLAAKLYYLSRSKKHPSPVKVSCLHEQDLEVGGDDEKNTQDLKNCCGEGGVDTELMRLHNLNGPPRFLFTIKEETKEELEDKCLNDFLDLSPLASPNSRVESSHEGISTLRSSPPSRFKFLRDADERWLRKMMEQVETVEVEKRTGRAALW
ncbi:hypothetical protein DCAR_0415109 [Daucus carota subsp. sativus]|uniref:Uncharacterized protein n=1 Tax=Daucus carota subsp. sativus TaxID=79200 RepID=A0A165A706_DAUCS|nr:PREDICTED: uncharacterized protein LOC108217079 [Daucus carota subsp. sativus]WOG95781.1 hypothetical protein DCAR_0415109 [Daucus carota subsp. sativus]